MKKRVSFGVVGCALLMLAVFGTVYALTYDGESYCRDHPAWPNGTYLGQMHRQHIDHYVKHFGEDGACERWAADQQQSAAAGLRRGGGYQVVRIEAPIPYEQNCGDLSVIPVGWKVTQVRQRDGGIYDNLHINFIFNNTGGPAYTDIPYTVTLYDEHMNVIRSRDLHFAVAENGRFELQVTDNAALGRTWLIHPRDVERLRCIKLTIDLERARKWFAPS